MENDLTGGGGEGGMFGGNGADVSSLYKGKKGKVQILGRQVISTLYMLVRNVKMYDAENEIFAQPLEALRETINTILAVDGKFELHAAGTVLSLNGMMIQVDFASLENVRHLTNEFKARDIGGLAVSRPVQTVELKAFLRAFGAGHENVEESMDGTVAVKFHKYRTIVEQLNKRSEAEIQQHRKIDRKKYALTVYARAVFYMRSFIDDVQRGGALPSTAPCSRLVRDFVDICKDQREHFLGMSTARQANEYLAYHSVNTSLLSVVIGSELKMSREQLHDLGKAAMLHDIGVALSMDQSALNKQGALTREEKDRLSQNPLYAAKVLLKGRPLDIGALKCILAAHEAKVSYCKSERDSSGRMRWIARDLGLFGRIIHVASSYDALTSARPYREAFSPEAALGMMCQEMKHEFDPMVLQLFCKVLAGQTTQLLAPGQNTFTVA